jgi:hypothetical protein
MATNLSPSWLDPGDVVRLGDGRKAVVLAEHLSAIATTYSVRLLDGSNSEIECAREDLAYEGTRTERRTPNHEIT